MKRPSITREMRREVARRVGAVEDAETPIGCHYCGDEIVIRWRRGRVQMLDAEGRFTPEMDHVVPLFVGGPHTADNLVPACLRCNRSKGVKKAPASASAQASAYTGALSDRSKPRPVPSRPVPDHARPDLQRSSIEFPG